MIPPVREANRLVHNHVARTPYSCVGLLRVIRLLAIENKLGNGVEKFTNPELFGTAKESEARNSTCGFAPQSVAPGHARPFGPEAEIQFSGRCFV